jgi:exodeoxyribonuclease V beta subunit
MAFYENFAYEASAGSGKTFALVIRYISLLYMGAKPETILTLTFTNKAANEMSARISMVLKELHLKKRQAELREIASVLEVDEKELLAKREEILHNFLTADIKISTIDKFFAQILRKFSLHLGLMPDFTIDEKEDEAKFLERFLFLVKQEGKYKELIEFSVHESKKLQSIFSFLERLYEKDGELAAISITKGDTFAIQSRILSVADSLRELFYSCETLSQRGRKSLDFTSIEDIIEKSWLCKESMEYWDFKKCYTPRADELQQALKELIQMYHLAKEGYFKEAYFSLYKRYKEAKKQENIQTNLLKFNDISYFVHQLLRGDIDSAFLYFRLDAKIEHLLLDEFQDTNVLQYSILEPIIDEITAGIGTKSFRSFFYVGDIKQSIYRFRGGAKELFYHTARRYGVKVDALKINYRSSYQVVNFVNEVFRDKITNYTDQISCDESQAGYICIEEHEEILTCVVENLFKLLDAGVKQDDIAILTYANGDAFRIEEALLARDASLDITTETSIKLINDRKVSAVIELLKYLYFKEPLYKANFLAAIGESSDSSITFTMSIHTPLPTIIREIITFYKLGDRDENLLKLITLSASYKDIESFLFESENITVDAPSKKSSGIRILTIHKSKGLEFDHVLVVDRFKRKSGDTSSMVFEYEDIFLKELYVKFPKRECVDSAYAGAIEKEKKLVLEDELNVQYVAFTRAKSSLIICKKMKESAFANLDLEPKEIGLLKVEESIELKAEIEPFVYQAPRVGAQEERVKKEKDERENIQAIHFGVALHYMLEILQDFDLAYVQEAYWAMKNRFEMLLQEGEAELIKKRVEKLLYHDKFLSLVAGKLLKEQPIAYEGELKQIDLLVEHEESVVVIDYKSSATQQQAHIKQVSYYKEALSKIVDKKVEAYLCYLREDEVVLVEV